jgi:hypothetical protein
MTLKTLRSRLSPQDLFSFYELQIRGQARSEFRRFSQGEWQLLAIKSSQCYVTIQARQTIEGSEGTIAVTAVPEPEMVRITSDFPRPLTTRILSLQEYDDAGIESEHISLSSSRSITLESRAFLHELTRDGWQVIRQPTLETARGAVIEAQRGAQQAFLTLLPDHVQPSMTTIVVIWRKS